jgi:cytochrome c oxidase subunit 1
MLGMPRRTYRYDAEQGWELYNQMSSYGAYLLGVATLIGVWNLVRSLKRGAVAGNDPWAAPSLEWSIPSPPPDYNFATLPKVTSRYPLWDLKSPDLSRDVPHDAEGEARIDVALGGREVAHGVQVATTPDTDPARRPVRPEHAHRTARELGIAMPLPTIKPLIAALGIVVMFTGPLFLNTDKTSVGVGLMLAGAAILVGALYLWLLSPLEEEH